MKTFRILSIFFALQFFLFLMPYQSHALENYFQDLPEGIHLKSRSSISREQIIPISQKLSGKIDKLINAVLIVQGNPVQVNIIETPSEEDSQKIYQSLRQMKKAPEFCVKNGTTIIEYVTRNPNLALKISYELKFLRKPSQLKYTVNARVATVEQADYMSINTLFNILNKSNYQDLSREELKEIQTISKSFQFGNQIHLRAENSDKPIVYNFPSAEENIVANQSGNRIYSFKTLQKSYGIPYIHFSAQVQTNQTGFTPSNRQADTDLISATFFWPSEDKEIQQLAQKIITGKTTIHDKIMAILQWLKPGKNIQFG